VKLLVNSIRSYYFWDEMSMTNVLCAVEKGEMSVRQASEVFGVYKSTLHDHVTKRWWQRLFQKHSEITLRTAVPLLMVRAKNC
jgi:hypothetical protein